MSEKTFLVEMALKKRHQKHLRSPGQSFAVKITAQLDNAGLAHGTCQACCSASSGAESS